MSVPQLDPDEVDPITLAPMRREEHARRDAADERYGPDRTKVSSFEPGQPVKRFVTINEAKGDPTVSSFKAGGRVKRFVTTPGQRPSV